MSSPGDALAHLAAKEQSLSARKATPKTGTCEWCYGSLTGMIHHIEHYRALHLALVAKDKDIAELEAEVERLRQLIRTHGPCGPNCLLLIHMEERGGREETPGGGTSPSGVSPSPPPSSRPVKQRINRRREIDEIRKERAP